VEQSSTLPDRAVRVSVTALSTSITSTQSQQKSWQMQTFNKAFANVKNASALGVSVYAIVSGFFSSK